MLVKPNKLVNAIKPFGKTGAINDTFNNRFRTFSVYNISGGCDVVVNGENTMTIPAGVTVNFDAGSDNNVINRFTSKSFNVVCQDCIIVGTI